eukprot:symbB.v1.2.027863.t1/scaffold2893.1/size70037/3
MFHMRIRGTTQSIYKDFDVSSSCEGLTLSDCQLTDSACVELLNNLIRCKSLTRIDLSRNVISSGSAFQPLLKRFSQLEELDLHWNHFGGEASALLQGIIECHNGGLRVLNISWNPLGKLNAEENCQQLVRLFKETKTLRHLDLSRCDLTIAHCQILAEGLEENKTIVGLHVSGNEAHVDAQGFLVPRRSSQPQEAVLRIFFKGLPIQAIMASASGRLLLALCLLVAVLGPCFQIPGITGKPMKRPKPRGKRQELQQCPQKGGIVTRVYTLSPKKPNSAIRKVCRLKLSTGKESIAYIPGEGHSLQEFASVLMRGGRRRDLVGMRYCLCRGARDLQGVVGRRQSRSKYGTEKPSDDGK